MKSPLLLSVLLSATPAFAMDTANFIISRIHEEPTRDTREMQLKGHGETLHVDRNTVIYDRDVTDAFVIPDGERARVVVKLSPEGKAKLEKLTEEWKGKRLAIVVFDALLGAPTISQKISTESFEISGAFSNDEAEKIVNAFKKK